MDPKIWTYIRVTKSDPLYPASVIWQKWFIKISEFDISFEPGKALKTQVFVDF